MGKRLFAITALVGLGLAGCNETAPPPSAAGAGAGALTEAAPRDQWSAMKAMAAPSPAAPPAGSGAAAGAVAAAGGAGSGDASARSPAAPGGAQAAPSRGAIVAASGDAVPSADAQWTLHCFTVQGPSHVEEANGLKSALQRRTGRREWYAIHGATESHLYFGFYRAIGASAAANDAADAKRAQSDKQVVSELKDDRGNLPFRNSSFVRLSAPDPTSRPEWDLANVDLSKQPKDPTRKFWSLQIAAFRDDPKRKEAAVQAVEGLRKNGYEAYYFHGPSISSVCIGAWRPDAVKEHIIDPKMPDLATAKDPSTLLVVTSEPLPESLSPRKPQGAGQVAAISPQLDVVDPSMTAAIKGFPNHMVNYEFVIHRGRNGQVVRDPSFLVMIPRAQGNGLYDSEPSIPRSSDRDGWAGADRSRSPFVDLDAAARRGGGTGSGIDGRVGLTETLSTDRPPRRLAAPTAPPQPDPRAAPPEAGRPRRAGAP